ncbi:hypothetical protein HWV62_26562 [Athelia sp. TMB]|nr:hypothetical protein HWV62_26562 [Athelia sp. TMB]
MDDVICTLPANLEPNQPPTPDSQKVYNLVGPASESDLADRRYGLLNKQDSVGVGGVAHTSERDVRGKHAGDLRSGRRARTDGSGTHDNEDQGAVAVADAPHPVAEEAGLSVSRAPQPARADSGLRDHRDDALRCEGSRQTRCARSPR